MYADQTLDPAEARLLQSKWCSRVRRLAKITHYGTNDLQCLSLIFYKICNTYEWWGAHRSGKTNRLDIIGFRDAMSCLLDSSDSNVLDRLFMTMDKNNRRYIGADTWLKAMSTLGVGTPYEKAAFCWQAYDHRGEMQITRNQMTQFMKLQFADVSNEDIESMCKEFVDVILKDTKAGKDGFMTFPEYIQIVEKRPLYREFLGKVLPNRLPMETFMATFKPTSKRNPPCSLEHYQ